MFVDACVKEKNYLYLQDVIDENQMLHLISKAIQNGEIGAIYPIIEQNKVKLTNEQKAHWIDKAISQRYIPQIIELIRQNKINLTEEQQAKLVNIAIENNQTLHQLLELIEGKKIILNNEQRKAFIRACVNKRIYSYLENIITKDEMLNLVNNARDNQQLQQYSLFRNCFISQPDQRKFIQFKDLMDARDFVIKSTIQTLYSNLQEIFKNKESRMELLNTYKNNFSVIQQNFLNPNIEYKESMQSMNKDNIDNKILQTYDHYLETIGKPNEKFEDLTGDEKLMFKIIAYIYVGNNQGNSIDDFCQDISSNQTTRILEEITIEKIKEATKGNDNFLNLLSCKNACPHDVGGVIQNFFQNNNLSTITLNKTLLNNLKSQADNCIETLQLKTEKTKEEKLILNLIALSNMTTKLHCEEQEEKSQTTCLVPFLLALTEDKKITEREFLNYVKHSPFIRFYKDGDFKEEIECPKYVEKLDDFFNFLKTINKEITEEIYGKIERRKSEIKIEKAIEESEIKLEIPIRNGMKTEEKKRINLSNILSHK